MTDRMLTTAEVACLEAACAHHDWRVKVLDVGLIHDLENGDLTPPPERVLPVLELADAVHRRLVGFETPIFRTLFERAAHRCDVEEAEGLFEILDDGHVGEELLVQAYRGMAKCSLQRNEAVPSVTPGIEELVADVIRRSR